MGENEYFCGAMSIPEQALLGEVIFKTSRSGGKGGQNVNKVSTKVELVFDIAASALFTDTQKEKLLRKLAGKLDTEGLLHVVSQASRSQMDNKKTATTKLLTLLENGLKDPKKRVATKPKKSSVQARLNTKKKTGEIKKLRGERPDF